MNVPIKVDLMTNRLTADQEGDLLEALEEYRYEVFSRENEWLTASQIREALKIEVVDANHAYDICDDVTPCGMIKISGYCSEEFWNDLDGVYSEYDVDATDYGFEAIRARDAYIMSLLEKGITGVSLRFPN